MEINDCLKNELLLEINDFGQTKQISSFYSLAFLLQRLFLIYPGTYPNHPDLGIGIQNYKFEFLDDTTLSEIQTIAMKNVNNYLPNNYIDNIIVERITSDSEKNQNIIGIKAILNKSLNNQDDIIFTFEQGKNGKIISKIFI